MEIENAKILYEENSRVAQTFWEWRHKIINRFFVAIASIFIVTSWMLTNNKFRDCIFIPFVLGAVYSLISKKMDDVNTWILRDCYEIGNKLEKEIGGVEYIFGKIDTEHSSRGSYAKLLSILYVSSGVVMMILAIISLFVYTF